MPNRASRRVNVYLLDDHDIVRQGIRDLLAPARDVLVVGDSGLAAAAPSSILRLGAEIMVLDLHLQDGSGVHVCRQVRAVDDSVRGLLVTSADDDEALAAAVLAGASGFVVKLARSSNILGAIRSLGEGRTLLDQDLMDRAANLVRARAEALDPRLDAHQAQLLELLLAGRTDREVAEYLRADLAQTQQEVTALIERLMSPRPRTDGFGEARPEGG